jgi:hypothetical protein
MREDALWVTEKAFTAADTGPGVTVELRWSSRYPTITMTRLNDVLFVRPRFLREATQPRLFHERYVLEDGIPFIAYLEQFETVWDAARIPARADLDKFKNPTVG